MENKTAVIIGRFQVPYLHLGHIYLISYALQNYDKVVILLGTIEYKDEKNPYEYDRRVKMINKVFPQVITHPLYDIPGDDVLWSQQVDMEMIILKDPVLLHSRDSFKDHYKGKYPLVEIPELEGYSGTKTRKEVGSGTTLS